jgi:hypothetical protein
LFFSTMSEDRVVLPPCVEPIKYKLRLTPDLSAFTCDGEEKIDIEVERREGGMTEKGRVRRVGRMTEKDVREAETEINYLMFSFFSILNPKSGPTTHQLHLSPLTRNSHSVRTINNK